MHSPIYKVPLEPGRNSVREHYGRNNVQFIIPMQIAVGHRLLILNLKIEFKTSNKTEHTL